MTEPSRNGATGSTAFAGARTVPGIGNRGPPRENCGDVAVRVENPSLPDPLDDFGTVLAGTDRPTDSQVRPMPAIL